MVVVLLLFFFFKQKTAYEMRISDWSSDVCSSDLSAEDPEADIFLHINSPGGSVDAGMAIYDTMNYIPNDVATVGMGLAASMGQFLLCAGAKGKRDRKSVV